MDTETSRVAKLLADQAEEIVKLKKKNAELVEALHQWDALIQHQYTGSKQAMSDMTDAAQHTAFLLYGDAPWPKPKATGGE